MSKSRFYLVAQEKDGVDFDVISLKPKDLYNEEKNSKYSPTLEEIDLFTTKFNDEFALNKYLIEEYGINTDSLKDIYIVKRTNNKIEFYEPLYKNNREKIENIAISSKEGNIESADKEILKVIRGFISRVEKQYNFKKYILQKDNNIYYDFLNRLKRGDSNNMNLQRVVYDCPYSKTSYPLIRNILEANNRYEKYIRTSKIKISNTPERRIIIPSLLEVTDKEFTPGQLSLFDYFDERDGKTYAKKYNN